MWQQQTIDSDCSDEALLLAGVLELVQLVVCNRDTQSDESLVLVYLFISEKYVNKDAITL